MAPEQDIDGAEKVSRFIYDSDKIAGDGRPKPNAFFPRHEVDLGRYETSLCRLICEEHRVWQLAHQPARQQTLKARADFLAAAAGAAQLRCVSAPVQDFEEHAVLIEWPPVERKDEWKAMGLTLARASGQVVRPPSVQ